MNVSALVAAQREYFASGVTRPVGFRLDALKRLREAVLAHEQQLHDALAADLNKCPSESYLCETGIVLDELRCHLKHLRSWARDRRVPTPLAQFCSVSFQSPEPYGVTLIMAPWNYPLQLCLCPLIGAISAGNCAILKPSAYAPATSHALAQILGDTFDPRYIAVIEGGREQNNALLAQRFDYIFFTGSVAVGKVVMEAASKHLTPVSLELGGKSPVIVDSTADIPVAARRVAFGKTLNAGQTCVAPDYVFVHAEVKDAFIASYRQALHEFFPTGDYSDYPHIVNEKHFRRLLGLLEGENAVIGGSWDESARQIEPTVLDNVSPDAPVMQEEIFGPILPLLPYTDLSQVIGFIRSRPKPLALYLFTRSRDIERQVLNSCSFGGGCINDTIIHLATHHMGFGGVGESGMGSYHGKFSFDTFSHTRAVVRKSFFPDLPMRYRPYSKRKDSLIRKFIK